MELFKNIRLKIGRSNLKKKIVRLKRTKFTGNIDNAKSIGIVWDASITDNSDSFSKFHQKLREKGADVKIIGYFNGKILNDKFTAVRYLTFLKKQDLNYFYKPVSPEANSFIKTDFDILIDINFKKLFPLQYISSLSVAGLKVGLFDSESDNSPFDLMIELNGSHDITYYLNQVLHYLEKINSNSN